MHNFLHSIFITAVPKLILNEPTKPFSTTLLGNESVDWWIFLLLGLSPHKIWADDIGGLTFKQTDFKFSLFFKSLVCFKPPALLQNSSNFQCLEGYTHYVLSKRSGIIADHFVNSIRDHLQQIPGSSSLCHHEFSKWWNPFPSNSGIYQ